MHHLQNKTKAKTNYRIKIKYSENNTLNIYSVNTIQGT